MRLLGLLLLLSALFGVYLLIAAQIASYLLQIKVNLNYGAL
jgi:hypothetical protein